MDPILVALARQAGIHIMGVRDPQLQAENALSGVRLAADGSLACDTQPAMVSVSNSGIPAFLSTYIDPKLIEILVSPMKAAEIVGEEIKKGDWTTATAMFATVESTGQVASYGDYSENGNAGTNVNWPQRQSFHYQVMTQWGEKELEMAGLARIDHANRLNIASALTLNKYQNKSYFFGIDGLENYGLLNDPDLSAAVTPTTKTAGNGNVWIYNGAVNATALEVVADIQKMFYTLQGQANGLVETTTKMTLAMSPTAQIAMTIPVQYGLIVGDYLKKIFPNMRIEVAPEYDTDSGELVQLIADEVEGQRTAVVAFTEKMRAHPIVIGTSNFKQKKSQGTWGCIVFRPFLISQMLGV